MGATWIYVFYIFLISSSWRLEYLHIQKKMVFVDVLS
jgi:hypothetical protein